MPAKHSRHIDLIGPLAEWVDSQVSKGEYTSASDLVRTAIRLLCEQDEAKQVSGDVLSPERQNAQLRV